MAGITLTDFGSNRHKLHRYKFSYHTIATTTPHCSFQKEYIKIYAKKPRNTCINGKLKTLGSSIPLINKTNNSNNVIINKTKVLLPQAYVILADFGYPCIGPLVLLLPKL